MIAVDTNVLLRYLLADDIKQSPLVAKLFKGNEPILITDIVLVEALWTLKGKKYRLEKEQLIFVIQALFEEPNICFENSQIVWLAFNAWRDAKSVRGKSADFSDALIACKAKYCVNLKNEPFGGVYTFDKAAQLLTNMKALQ